MGASNVDVSVPRKLRLLTSNLLYDHAHSRHIWSSAVQFKYRQHPSISDLVQCVQGGTDGQIYLVWPRTGTVLGANRPTAQ